MSRRIGTSPERVKQYGLPAEGMNANWLVLLCANVRDPRKTQIRYDRNGRRETAMGGENVTFSNLHLRTRSGNDIHNCDNFCNLGRSEAGWLELFVIWGLLDLKVQDRGLDPSLGKRIVHLRL
jgi:hypothetical protein